MGFASESQRDLIPRLRGLPIAAAAAGLPETVPRAAGAAAGDKILEKLNTQHAATRSPHFFWMVEMKRLYFIGQVELLAR